MHRSGARAGQWASWDAGATCVVRSAPGEGCAGGALYACQLLAEALDTGEGVAKSAARLQALVARTFPLLETQCRAGRAAACGEQATFTERGWGTTKDEKVAATLKLKAATIYTAACERGDATACYTAGACFELGSYVDADASRAKALYQLGCDGAEGSSCFALGSTRYSDGGTVRDPEGAAPLLKKGCELGSSASCLLLGRIFAEGEGVPRDALRGRELIERACTGPGDARLGAACSEAAVMRLDQGESRLSDAVRALVVRGCDLGDETSCKMRDTSLP